MDSRAKTKWMICVILAPEYLVGKALSELLAAKSAVATWSERHVECKEIHGYMANKGHFVLDTQEDDRNEIGETPEA